MYAAKGSIVSLLMALMMNLMDVYNTLICACMVDRVCMFVWCRPRGVTSIGSCTTSAWKIITVYALIAFISIKHTTKMREGVCFFPGVGAEHKKGVKMSKYFEKGYNRYDQSCSCVIICGKDMQLRATSKCIVFGK